jgi:hypothetical protein
MVRLWPYRRIAERLRQAMVASESHWTVLTSRLVWTVVSAWS